jgi:hypothetical protein
MGDFNVALEHFKNELSKNIYGMSKSEAIAKNICVSCKQPPTFYSDAGKAEYKISGLCEPCWDKIFSEGEK